VNSAEKVGEGKQIPGREVESAYAVKPIAFILTVIHAVSSPAPSIPL
jgi:hypothetical protein